MLKKLAAAFVVSATISISAFGQQSKVDDLGWMAGCWEINDTAKGRVVTEQWMKPLGGMMLGGSRTVKDGKANFYEYMRLIEKDGAVYYVARPQQNAEDTFFKLVRSNAAEAVFEQPGHDFPQRIIYRRNGEKLNARIEGKNEGKEMGIDYPYVQTECR